MPPVGQTRSERWPQIAALCEMEPRTIYGIAKALGTRTGSVKSVLDSMCADSLLRVRPGERGQVYTLTRKGKAALRRADAAASVRVALPAGARVLLVVDEGRAIAAGLLEQLSEEPELRWSARLDGLVRWMVVFGSADAATVDRVAALVEAAGCRPIVVRADEVLNATQLRAYARQVAASGPAALVAG